MIESGIATLANELVDRIKEQVQLEAKASLPQTGQPRLLTVKQAAEYIARSEQAVRHLIFQRDLPVVRHGRCVRLDRKDLDQWIDQNKV